MTGYYDYVLGLIPATLLGTTFALEGLGWSTHVAVPVGGVVAAVLVAHAMFVRVPASDATVPDAPVRPTGPDAGGSPGTPQNGD